jgi:DNA-binding SARP family transcriptional activator
MSDYQTAHPTELRLFGGPYVIVGGVMRTIPEGCKRLLAFVALRRSRVERRLAAGALWPIGDDNRAAGNLRSALWRLRGAGIDLLRCDKWSLSLDPDVVVDVHAVDDWADRVIGGRPTDADLAMTPQCSEALDLLPGWYDDWTVIERERLRQQILHAIESLSRHLVVQGRFAEAVAAALAAVSAEPLRESAQRVLIEAHISEGNWFEARRTFDAHREHLRRELDVPPSAELIALVYPALRQRGQAGINGHQPPPKRTVGTGSGPEYCSTASAGGHPARRRT